MIGNSAGFLPNYGKLARRSRDYQEDFLMTDLHWQASRDGQYARDGDLIAIISHDRNSLLQSYEYRVKVLRDRGLGLAVVCDGHARNEPAAKGLAAEFLIETRRGV